MSVTSSGRWSEQHDQTAFGVVARDGGGQLLEQYRLAGLGRGDDQTALALADGEQDEDDASGHAARRVLQAEPVARVQRGEVVEVRAAAQLFGGAAVDPLDLGEGAGSAAYAFDGVALAQAVTADQRGGDLDVGRRGQAARRRAGTPARCARCRGHRWRGPGAASVREGVRVWWS